MRKSALIEVVNFVRTEKFANAVAVGSCASRNVPIDVSLPTLVVKVPSLSLVNVRLVVAAGLESPAGNVAMAVLGPVVDGLRSATATALNPTHLRPGTLRRLAGRVSDEEVVANCGPDR